MFGLFKKKEAPKLEASRIVPRIKNDQFEKAILEQGVPADQMPVIEPLVGDLFVTYAFDLGDTFMMVMRYHLAEIGLQAEDLREIGMANMRARTNARITSMGAFRRVSLGGDLDACALLSSRLWESNAAEHPGGVVAMAPTRDTLLYCDATSSEGRQGMVMTGALAFAAGGVHALSLQVMRWTPAGWVIDEGAGAAGTNS